MKQACLEFIGIFIVVFLFYYFMVIKKNLKYNGKSLTAELALIKYKYNINFEKVNFRQILWVTCLTTVFFLSLILTILFQFLNSNILVAFIAIIVSVPILLFVYWGIGAIYYKKGDK